MLRLAADENLNSAIVQVLLRKRPEIDVVRMQDSPVSGADDPAVLAWAADERRVVVSHDGRTLPPFAWERVREGRPMCGVFVVSQFASVGQTVDDLLLVVECSRVGEWEGRVVHLPF